MKKQNILLSVLVFGLTFGGCDNGTGTDGESINYTDEYLDYDSVPSFSKGVNFTRWFENAGNFSAYSAQDFADVKSLGIDVIRLPITYLLNMTQGAPDYIINPQLLRYLDRAVNWAERYQIYIILDNHPYVDGGLAPTNERNIQIFEKIWPQIAGHFKNRSKYVIYEILNEPQQNDISPGDWGRVQGEIIEAIRSIDQNHWIVVSGVHTSSDPAEGLSALPRYTDNKLLYTFHFYEPHLFTHQGTSWTDWEPLIGVPFPYDSSRMPSSLSDLGTWVENDLKNYSTNGTTAELTRKIDKVIDLARQRNVPIFCGEFGAYWQAPPEDRVRYYQFIRETLEARNIPWIIWDYFAEFGIFNIHRLNPSYSRPNFNTGLNVDLVRALGLTPPQ